MRIRPIAAALSVAGLLTACVTYEPRPIDLTSILANLEGVVVTEGATDPSVVPTSSVAGGINPEEMPRLTAAEAAGFAVVHHPELAARRAEVGVARAELIEAGLLDDPVASFDGMDAIAAAAVSGEAGTANFISGIGISWTLPRPGEIGAKENAARARIDEKRAELCRAEWRLLRDVFGAHTRLAAAEARLELNRRLRDIVRRTAEQIAAARGAGGATVLQENLAYLEAARLDQDGVRLDGDRRAAILAVNQLMGAPPGAKWTLEVDPTLWTATTVAEPSVLVQKALSSRPDLIGLMAAYRRAEADVRLEVSRQFPRIDLGTGIAITLPLATGFNGPGIRTAEARRTKLACEVEAAVFEVRREIHAACLNYDRVQAELDVLEKAVRPKIEQNLGLLQEALRLGGVTIAEVIAAQQQIIATEERSLDLKVQRAQAKIELDSITGRGPIDFRSADAADAPSKEPGIDPEKER